MTYSINKTNPFDGNDILVEEFSTNGTVHPVSTTLAEGSVSADTSLSLFGRGRPNYGESLAENMVNMLENYSGSTPPSNPINGQLWACRIDYILTSTGNWFQWDVSLSTWVSFTPQSGTPSTFVHGEFWYDGAILRRSVNRTNHPLSQTAIAIKFIETSEIADPNAAGFKPIVELLVYNDGKWIGSSDVYAGPIPPLRVETGKVWFDTVNTTLKIYINGQFVGIFDNYLSLDGGTMNGTIDMGENPIINLPTPENDNDAVTKKYVDDAIDSIEVDTSDFILRDGSVAMTANFDSGQFKLSNVATPTNDHDAATKKYVDDEINGNSVDTSEFLLRDGSVALTGNFQAGGNRLTNIAKAEDSNTTDAVSVEYLNERLDSLDYIKADGSVSMAASLDLDDNYIINLKYPTADTHAASKKYVDDIFTTATEANDTSEFLLRNGSVALTGNLQAGGNNITNIVTRSSEPTDATSVQFVNDLFTDSGYLKSDGSVVMTGNFDLNNQFIANLKYPTVDTHAASKKYVDDRIDTVVPDTSEFAKVDGTRTFSGNIRMGDNKVTGLAEPTDQTDGATKDYVDNNATSVVDRYLYVELTTSTSLSSSDNGSTIITGDLTRSDPLNAYNTSNGEIDLSVFTNSGRATFRFSIYAEWENISAGEEFSVGFDLFYTSNQGNDISIGHITSNKMPETATDPLYQSGLIHERMLVDNRMKVSTLIEGEPVDQQLNKVKLYVEVLDLDGA